MADDQEPSEADRIARNFREFDRAHPEVWRLFKHFAQLSFDAQVGVPMDDRRGSASQIFERIRWEASVGDVRHYGHLPKLNNNYRALYARKWIETFPTRKAFFATRKRSSASADSTRLTDPIYTETA